VGLISIISVSICAGSARGTTLVHACLSDKQSSCQVRQMHGDSLYFNDFFHWHNAAYGPELWLQASEKWVTILQLHSHLPLLHSDSRPVLQGEQSGPTWRETLLSIF